jgi:acetyl esterase
MLTLEKAGILPCGRILRPPSHGVREQPIEAERRQQHGDQRNSLVDAHTSAFQPYTGCRAEQAGHGAAAAPIRAVRGHDTGERVALVARLGEAGLILSMTTHGVIGRPLSPGSGRRVEQGEVTRRVRRRILLCLLALAVAETVTGAGQSAGECVPFEVTRPEGNYIVPGVQGGIVYRRLNGQALELDAYVQRGGGRRPAVVVVHGGGWSSGSRVAFVGQFLELLTRAGYNWIAIDYRLGGLDQYAKAVDDVVAAVAFLRCHAATLQVDPDRIALLGEDAGAHLVALAAGRRLRGVRGAILAGGFYELAAAGRLASTTDAAVLRAASPAGMTVPRDVRFLVVHGTADTEVPAAQAVAFCERVGVSGGDCEYLPVNDGIHRPENWRPGQWSYKARLIDWLDDTLQLGEANHVPYDAPPLKDIPYGPDDRHVLDAWIPDGAGPFAAVVLVHGGGWEAGDKVTYITPLFEPLSRAGFAWFSINYRLSPDVRHPEQLDDVRRALRFVREHAGRFRVDPERIALIGESASGQMAALLATEDRRLAATVSFYGVYDFLPMVTDASPRSLLVRLFGHSTLNDEARALLRRYSPIAHVHRDMPPLLLVHGTNERLWEQGRTMAARLAEVGVRHELVALEGAPHGMENWEGHPEWTGYKERLVEWLRVQLPR